MDTGWSKKAKAHYTMLQLKIFTELYYVIFLLACNFSKKKKKLFTATLHVLRNGRDVTETSELRSRTGKEQNQVKM